MSPIANEVGVTAPVRFDSVSTARMPSRKKAVHETVYPTRTPTPAARGVRECRVKSAARGTHEMGSATTTSKATQNPDQSPPAGCCTPLRTRPMISTTVDASTSQPR